MTFLEEKPTEEIVFDGSTKTNRMSIALYISLLAIFTALTTVATIVFVVPIPSTSGFFNLGDALVMISGLLLGPVGGLVAGGVGSAMGDVALGYFGFAPFTLAIKGCEGLVVGLISRRSKGSRTPRPWDILAVILAATVMLVGYFVAEVFFLGLSPEAAFVELVAANSIQVSVGAVVTLLVGPMLRGFLREYVPEIL